MEIVSGHVHRVIAYIEALNRHGAKPSRAVVNVFAERPDRKEPRRSSQMQRTLGQFLSASLSQWNFDTVEGGETFTQYLDRLGWIEPEQEVQLTPVGRALLKALNSPVLEDAAADVFEIVLEPSDPFAYAQALGALSTAKHAMLVEPFFRLEQLMDIAEFDNIERVLVGPGLKPRDLEVLATGLAALPSTRPLEVRVASALHDRYLIPEVEGRVTMLGTSLGGIGKKVSTITTLGEVASTALRDAHDKIWRAAQVLEPKAPAKGVKSVAAPAQGATPARSAAAKKTPAAKKAPTKAAAKRRGTQK